MSTQISKPRLVDPDVFKKVIKANKITSNNGVFQNLFSYTCNGLVYVIKNYSDFIFVLLALFVVLYMRYKYNSQNKKVVLKNQVEVNYIRNKDYLDGEIYDINDDIKSEEKLDDNIIGAIKKEINKIENKEMEAMPLNGFQSYSEY